MGDAEQQDASEGSAAGPAQEDMPAGNGNSENY